MHEQGSGQRYVYSGSQYAPASAPLEEDYDHLARQLARRGVDAEPLVERAMAFKVAVPSWGLGSGGTRFARFAIPGEPRNVFEKLEDCEVVFKLTRATPGISLHIPWDKTGNPGGAAGVRRRRAGCSSTR